MLRKSLKLGTAFLLAALGAACSSTETQKSTGTNWIVCKSDVDCAGHPDTHCGSDEKCVAGPSGQPASPDAGSGGGASGGDRGATGGGAGTTGSGATTGSSGGTTGSGATTGSSGATTGSSGGTTGSGGGTTGSGGQASEGCEVDGVRYALGVSFPSPFDACNTCQCSASGDLQCTLVECTVPPTACATNTIEAKACAECRELGGCALWLYGCLPRCETNADCPGTGIRTCDGTTHVCNVEGCL